jgi:hypothetical protein
MLANYIFDKSYKLVLFVDEVGAERSLQGALENALHEASINYEKYEQSRKLENKTCILLPPLSKMELTRNEQQIFHLIQRIKDDENVTQALCVATVSNISSDILVKFIEYMSDIIVTVSSNQLLSILTKRKHGPVKFKEFEHELLKGSLKLTAKRIQKLTEIKSEEHPEDIGTFKIGKFKHDELEAKKNMKLPYEIM